VLPVHLLASDDHAVLKRVSSQEGIAAIPRAASREPEATNAETIDQPHTGRFCRARGHSINCCIALTLLVAACSGSAPPPSIGLANNTQQAVKLLVNRRMIADVAPGTESGDLSSKVPGVPWHLEVRDGDGHVLLQEDVAADATGGGQVRTAALGCGAVTLWWARGMPSIAPAPSPSACSP